MAKPKRGAPKGHPGWGGRPKGDRLAICMKCGAELTAAELRTHFGKCEGVGKFPMACPHCDGKACAACGYLPYPEMQDEANPDYYPIKRGSK